MTVGLGSVIWMAIKLHRGILTMQSLRRVWADIRQGENIDLYVTALIAISLAGFNVVGIAPQSWITSITLAVLAVLIVAELGNRHRLEAVLQQTDQGLRFLEEYPPKETLRNKIENAQELWLVGINLGRTIRDYYPDLEKMLKRGGSVQVLVMKPDGDAIKTSVERSYRGVKPKEARRTIRETLASLCVLHAIRPGGIRICTLDYPLPFGAYVVDPNSAIGTIYLKNYSYKMSEWDKPRLILGPQDGKWYEFFKKQISVMFETGEEWKCTNASSRHQPPVALVSDECAQ